MKTDINKLVRLVLLSLSVAVVAVVFAPAAHVQKDSTKASMQTKGGLHVVTFDTLNGQVIVNLPDDMMAGDTISGTVITEPKGQTKEEQAKNQAEQSRKWFELTTAPAPSGTSDLNVKIPLSATITPFTFSIPKVPAGGSTSATFIFPWVTAGDPGRVDVVWYGSNTGVPVDPAPPTGDSRLYAPNDFRLPSMGQQGRPIEIIGPFDGNSQDTTLNWTRARSAVQDFEKNTENVSGGFGLIDGQPIAESPRKAVFQIPTNVTGPIEIHLKEGNKETKATFRNLSVNLTAPKTSLLKGESTELHVQVSGLQGITEPVPLHLTKGGVVTMQGGDVQTMSIKPAEVQANGTFTTTRTITGVQAGVWSATATVVVFNVCLQDDNNGNSIILNRETGDYIFCQGRSGLAGANPISLGTMDFSGGVSVLTGSGADASKKGSTFNLEHNTPDRRVLINLSAGSFPPSGTATVQTTNPKRTFTITDRDTRNNTCTCR